MRIYFESYETLYITVLQVYGLIALLLVVRERVNGCFAFSYCTTVITREERKCWLCVSNRVEENWFCLQLLQYCWY
jgi:hypothetical protein